MEKPVPLLDRLSTELGYPLLDATGVDAFIAEPGVSVLFFTEDPARFAETLDVAVVLPELLSAFPSLRPAVVARSAEKALQKRYGFSRWPALVFLRDGEYLETITGIQDWSEYLQTIAGLLQAPVRRPPSIGIPVVGAPGGHP